MYDKILDYDPKNIKIINKKSKKIKKISNLVLSLLTIQ